LCAFERIPVILCDAIAPPPQARESLPYVVTLPSGIESAASTTRSLKVFPCLTFTSFLVSLVTVGERTGSLEHVLKTFADYTDEELDYTLKNLTTILEPILLLVMGVIIGSIALSVLLPIYQYIERSAL
jgi:type II secretory pathway component PulF